MKDKVKSILNDEKKKTLLILIIVTIIIIAIVITIFLVVKPDAKKNFNTTTTKTTTTKEKDLFRGFDTKEFNYTDSSIKVTYDLKSKHEFIYANGEDKKTIYTNDTKNEYYYELNLDNGAILFKEQKYNSNLNAYEFTGKNYKFTGEANITDYLVVSTCENDSYSIIAKDQKNNVYVFKNPDKEFNITYIINNLNKTKLISKASKIGYYNYNNYPYKECNEYDLIYLDTSNNIRYLSGKNALFFDEAYYRYIGSSELGNIIYVLKDGLMQYEDNSKNLNDGNHNINYMGSFYVSENNTDIIYIIGTDGYIYKIENFSSSSSTILKKLKETRLKKIGTKIITDNNNYATDKTIIKVEFETGEIFEFPVVKEFELLK